MFKVRAFRNSAQIIAELPEKVTSAEQLKGVKGIGKGSLALVRARLQTHLKPLLLSANLPWSSPSIVCGPGSIRAVAEPCQLPLERVASTAKPLCRCKLAVSQRSACDVPGGGSAPMCTALSCARGCTLLDAEA